MFSKDLIACAVVFFGLSLQASAQAVIAPALGVSGTPVSSDAQQPSSGAECGSVNIAQNINTATPITAAADGSFSATITNFETGTDGSRQVTALVDPTGTGDSFVSATVSQNGDQSPTALGSQTLSVQLPSGTTCSGGTAGDLCLVSFTTAGGFGNCVVVQQDTAAAGSTGSGNTGSTGSGNTGSTGSGNAGTAGNGNAGSTGNVNAGANGGGSNAGPKRDVNVGWKRQGNAPPNGNANAPPNGNANAPPNGNANAPPNGNANAPPNGNANAVPNGNANAAPNGNVNAAATGNRNAAANGNANAGKQPAPAPQPQPQPKPKPQAQPQPKPKAPRDFRAVGSRAARALRAALEEWM